jgi:hypothetical protein
VVPSNVSHVQVRGSEPKADFTVIANLVVEALGFTRFICGFVEQF